jgi:hypothetical protein
MPFAEFRPQRLSGQVKSLLKQIDAVGLSSYGRKNGAAFFVEVRNVELQNVEIKIEVKMYVHRYH